MRFFRIGDFARRMGVSTHLLKHYEEEGVLHPIVRPNGYRYYTLHDSSLLLECRALRNVDFSLKDMRELLFSGTPADLSAALGRRADGLEADLARKQILLEELRRQQALLARMEAGEAEILETEPAWYLPHVESGDFHENGSIYPLLEAWMAWMPVTCSCLMVSRETLLPDTAPQETRRFGMIVTDAAAKRCGIPTDSPAELLPPQRVMRFYLCAETGDGGNVPDGEIPAVIRAELACLERVRAVGETPCGTMRKTVLFYNAETREHYQYSILDIPLAEK